MVITACSIVQTCLPPVAAYNMLKWQSSAEVTVLFIWNLPRHARDSRSIYKTLLLSLLPGTTGVLSPWVHIWLQMPLVEIKDSHHAAFPNLSAGILLCLLSREGKSGGKHNPVKLPHCFAGLIVVLYM